MGGAGSAVAEAIAAAGIDRPLLQLGLPDRFIEHGDPAKLLSLCGLDAAGIERSIVERFGATLSAPAAEPADARAAA
jgi:1-deoxy-D-xylulose-5-phosphate synthase